MSRARNSTTPNERGKFLVWCEPCDVSGEFPTIEMAIAARRQHLCVGEVPSTSWPEWADGDPEVTP